MYYSYLKALFIGNLLTSKEFDASTINSMIGANVGGNRLCLIQTRILWLLLTFAITARIHVALFYEINWDEFYYLSFIYQYEYGTLSAQLQTFHVHLFNWLKWVSSNEAVQIKAARLVLVLFQIVTGYFIYRIARRFVSTPAALFSVLCYFAFAFNVRMGASFRADPLTTFFLMCSLALILSEKLGLKRLLLAGSCISIAILITIKSLLYLPTFGLIAIARYLDAPRKQQFLFKPLIVLVCTLLTLYGLSLFHGMFLHQPDSAVAVETIGDSFDKTIKTTTFLPGLLYLKYSLFYDLFIWLTLIYGAKVAWVSSLPQRQLSLSERLILLSFIFPLCAIFFYRNAFPYFYSFMLAPVTVLCGLAWDGIKLNQKSDRESNVIIGVILAFTALGIAYHGFIIPKQKNLQVQQEFVEQIHTLFPSPTNYIDCCSMIASYPKQGFFMSSWGMEAYRKSKQSLLKNAVITEQPIFLITNNHLLDLSRASESNTSLLFPEDFTALKQNYVQHWGPLYVAGKQLTLQARSTQFSIIVPGVYTLEATHGVVVDQQHLAPGDTLYLAAGKHMAKSPQVKQDITFRWGNRLYRPPKQSHYPPLFTGF